MTAPAPATGSSTKARPHSQHGNGLLDKVLSLVKWDELQRQAMFRREAGEYVGVGISFFLEKSGLGPVDGVRVTVDDSGTVEVTTSSASLGQGVETVIAQICADALGVNYSGVRVVHGRTDLLPWGFGAHAGRATVMTGSATHMAALKVRELALKVAATEMQATPEALDIADGKVIRKNEINGPSVTLAEIAKLLRPAAAISGDSHRD